MSRPRSDLEQEINGKAVSTTAAIEQCTVDIANQPTIAQYYVREHVRQSLPAVLQARNTLQSAKSTAQAGCYAATGGLEFSSTLSSVLSQSALDGLLAAVKEAEASAKSIQHQQKQEQQAAREGGGAMSSLSGTAAAARSLFSEWSKRAQRH